MRALAYVVAAADGHGAPPCRRGARAPAAQAFVDLMIPIVKGWSTETGIDVASLGVQVHGGMGFIEETGAAQHLRDARITTIYEGTTGIQAERTSSAARSRATAGDGEGGHRARCTTCEGQLERVGDADLAAIRAPLREGVGALARAVQNSSSATTRATSGSRVRRCRAFPQAVRHRSRRLADGARGPGRAEAPRREGRGRCRFYPTKIATARFFADHVLVQAPGLARTVVAGATGALAIEDDQF